MYGLDINFLNDRPEYKKDIPKPASSGPSLEDPRPILIGAAAAVAVNGLVAGGWLYLNQVNTKLQADLDKLNGELSKLNAQVKDLEAIKEKTKTFKAEAKALATVFDQIKPWSALLGEFGSLVPSGVIITSIEQKEAKVAPQPAPKKGEKEPPPPPPKPTATLSFAGTSDSYGQINDFLLLLQSSPFFQGEKTKLISAAKKPNPTRLELQESNSTLAPEIPELPPIVEYKIETNLSPLGASELLPQLKSKGAIGLVDRIETLTEKGVF
ncbi:PilN domain-containing protein [Dapis sp. BLCC M126]|uniref:PilN domain-containing protein n=1 Tax=Dapis sp. BLCC M126 TaxID=3400189 RepID=UPI003CEC2369